MTLIPLQNAATRRAIAAAWLSSALVLTALVLATWTTPALAQNQPDVNRLWPACPGCELSGHDFSNRLLDHVNLSRADLKNANFSGAVIRGVMFTGANLTGANFTGARIEASEDRLTTFMQADLTNANFTGAQLSGVDLQYADISCANFTNAVMTVAIAGELRQASTSCKATFTGARLSCSMAAQSTQFDLSGAIRPNCPTALPRASAAAVTSSAWMCPNTNLSGLSTLVYVGPSGQDNSTCGQSSTTPCLTIAQGLAQCTGSSCGVLVYYSTYKPTGTITLSSGRSLFGGCLATATPPDPSYVSLIDAPAGGAPAISANNVASATVQNFSIIGSDVTTTNGAPSIAMSIGGNSNVTLNHVSVTGGKGGGGATGAAGVRGGQGGSASGATGGTNASCSVGGGNGGVGMTTHVDYNMTKVTNCPSTCSANSCNGYNGAQSGTWGGQGGGRPNAYCQLQCISSCNNLNGYNGIAGGNGICGAPGTASSNINGTYTNGVWSASTGGNGNLGTNGTGGGGGGGGAACGYVCMWVPDNKSGASGGGGGAGSCGATPGLGGQQGGASIAVQVVQSTITLNTVTITAGAGGTGGNGGPNAPSTQGGSGTGGSTPSGASPVAGSGGRGGDGGWGAASGAGAGGNGGPSFGMTLVSMQQPSVATTKFYLGLSGGVGAAGALSNTSGAPCQATVAAVGNPGRVSDYLSID